MDLIHQIEDPIVQQSEGYFEADSDLHVTIRITVDFFHFLSTHQEMPSTDEVDYMCGTIRSGMDMFFLLAYSCNAIDTDSRTWAFDCEMPVTYKDLRASFLSRFEHVVRPELSAPDRLACLLALVHLELVFIAQHFPSAILGSG